MALAQAQARAHALFQTLSLPRRVELELALAHRAPASCLLLLLCVGASAWVRLRRLSPSLFSSSYAKVVTSKEYWRLATSPFVHGDAMHLALNALTIWQNKELEVYFGTQDFLRYSLLLLVLADALHLAAVHFYAKGRHGFPFESVQRQSWLGLSAVLFGWNVVHLGLPYLSEGDFLRLFGFLPVPASASTLVLQLCTQVLAWHPCHLNHAWGICAGYLVGVGLFEWVTPYFALCLAQWLAVLLQRSEGFPPQWDSVEVARQRRAEERFAGRAAASSSTPQPAAATPVAAGAPSVVAGTPSGPSQAATPSLSAAERAAARAEAALLATARTEELGYLLSASIEIPRRLLSSRSGSSSGSGDFAADGSASASSEDDGEQSSRLLDPADIV